MSLILSFPASLRQSLVLIFVAIAGTSHSAGEVSAQEVRKAIRDYKPGPTHYSPDDPWIRSNLFNRHTGHFGRFYNCDREECKRYSPFISWRTNCDPLLPECIGLRQGIQIERYNVIRRRNDGGCGPLVLPPDLTRSHSYRRAAEFLQNDVNRGESGIESSYGSGYDNEYGSGLGNEIGNEIGSGTGPGVAENSGVEMNFNSLELEQDRQ